MGKKKIEHIVFDGTRKQKNSIPFQKVNRAAPAPRMNRTKTAPQRHTDRRQNMNKRILIALDLEGVNHVVGEPYSGLGHSSPQWEIARAQAALEVNTAADALFAAGAETVALWDNHGGGHNVDSAALDGRICLLDPDPAKLRMYFAENRYDCICYFGYHAMEGTLGGVLAHTMSSVSVQYYKLNGQYIGEVDMDAYIAAAHGMPSVFFAGGHIACAQAERAVPGITTVITKREVSRNSAEFRDNEALLAEIREKIVQAVQKGGTPRPLAFPAVFEKSFKRIEDAAKHLEKQLAAGISAAYPKDPILGYDAHTVVSTVNTMEEFIRSI